MHMLRCPLKVVTCTVEGCSYVGYLKDLPAHMENSMASHIRLLENAREDMISEIMANVSQWPVYRIENRAIPCSPSRFTVPLQRSEQRRFTEKQSGMWVKKWTVENFPQACTDSISQDIPLTSAAFEVEGKKWRFFIHLFKIYFHFIDTLDKYLDLFNWNTYLPDPIYQSIPITTDFTWQCCYGKANLRY